MSILIGIQWADAAASRIGDWQLQDVINTSITSQTAREMKIDWKDETPAANKFARHSWNLALAEYGDAAEFYARRAVIEVEIQEEKREQH